MPADDAPPVDKLTELTGNHLILIRDITLEAAARAFEAILGIHTGDQAAKLLRAMKATIHG